LFLKASEEDPASYNEKNEEMKVVLLKQLKNS